MDNQGLTFEDVRDCQAQGAFCAADATAKEIRRLLREGRHKNVTELMRAAVDHYLESIGRPPLARQMADDYAAEASRAADRLQGRSRMTEESW